MTSIKFPHQQFLENNKEVIAAHPLPEMLQKRILGFEELQQDLPNTTDEDHASLLQKMEMLSNELDEDLEEYFETWLENNDEEKDADSPEQAETPAVETEQREAPEDPTRTLAEEPAGESEKEPEPHPEPEAFLELSDEDILRGLLEAGQTSIHPSELRKKGFKGILGHRCVPVGNHCLNRGKYDTCYRIEKRHE